MPVFLSTSVELISPARSDLVAPAAAACRWTLTPVEVVARHRSEFRQAPRAAESFTGGTPILVCGSRYRSRDHIPDQNQAPACA